MSGAYAPAVGPPPARRRSTRGAKILTFAGAAVLVAGCVAGVAGGVRFVDELPTGVVGPGGEPGPEVVASGAVPGTLEADLAEAGRYTVWEVDESAAELFEPEDVAATGPGQARVEPSSVSQHAGRDGVDASSVADVVVDAPGTYTITVGGDGAADGRAFVTRGTGFGEFFTGLGATIGLWFAAIGGALLGGSMAIGGIVWWVLARRT